MQPRGRCLVSGYITFDAVSTDDTQDPVIGRQCNRGFTALDEPDPSIELPALIREQLDRFGNGSLYLPSRRETRAVPAMSVPRARTRGPLLRLQSQAKRCCHHRRRSDQILPRNDDAGQRRHASRVVEGAVDHGAAVERGAVKIDAGQIAPREGD